jgi:hypothetical protein
VLDINGERIACGVTPGQITYQTHLGGKGHVGRAPGSGAGELPGPTAPAGAGPAAPSEPSARRAGAAARNGGGTPTARAEGTARMRSEGALPPALVQEAGLPGDPVHDFAEVLKQKVRSLKRIN